MLRPRVVLSVQRWQGASYIQGAERTAKRTEQAVEKGGPSQHKNFKKQRDWTRQALSRQQ